MQEQKRSRFAPRIGTPVPAWMQDRAVLEQIARAKLTAAGFEALTPGTRRFIGVVNQALDDLHQRLADAERVEPPF